MDIQQFEEKTLRCIDCNKDFTFTTGEQRFYASKNLSVPKRCSQCRTSRKATLVPEK